jgi:hypothetical protein
MLRVVVLSGLAMVRKWRKANKVSHREAIRSRVRGSVKTTLIASLLLVASVVSGFSQTQEVKLVDRIMKPNMELRSPMEGKSFSETGAVKLRNSPAASQGFYGIKDARTKDFPFTRSFFGLKNPWLGGKVYTTKETAMLSKYDIKKAAGAFEKSTDVSGFYASKKDASLGSPVVPVPTFVPSPAAPGAVSRISDKINEKMTIDEVRELLNKPR